MTLIEPHTENEERAAAISAEAPDDRPRSHSLQARVTQPMVLHVRVVTGQGGGPEKTILNSPRFLARLGYQSKLAYLHPPGDPGIDALRLKGEALQAEVLSVPDRGPLDVGVLRQLVSLCREHKVDLWHAHDYKSNLLGLLVRPLWRMKLVTTLHGWTNMSGRMPLYAKVDKWCLKYYRAAICVSDDLREECRRWRVPAERCHVVYNAIDTETTRRKLTRTQAKQQLGAPQDTLLIGAVGRLSPEKGFDLLIRAVAELRNQGRAVSLWIAGEGSARGDLERLAGELRCSDSIRLLGHVADPSLFYQALDVFALSSLREGLPNVVLEAMALEAPVVATSVAGVPTLIEDGESGLIVEPGSVASLAGGLERLLADEELRHRFVRSARERVESKFSFARRMERIVSIYDQVLGRR